MSDVAFHSSPLNPRKSSLACCSTSRRHNSQYSTYLHHVGCLVLFDARYAAASQRTGAPGPECFFGTVSTTSILSRRRRIPLISSTASTCLSRFLHRQNPLGHGNELSRSTLEDDSSRTSRRTHVPFTKNPLFTTSPTYPMEGPPRDDRYLRRSHPPRSTQEDGRNAQ